MSFACALITVGVALCPLQALASSLQDVFRLERLEAATRWAPLVWLHPSENYFPSSVPHFLRHITLSTEEGREHARAEERQGTEAPELILPGGKPSRDYFLTAQHDFGCMDCTLPVFLRGEKPRKKYSPPVYVTVHSCSSKPSGRTTRSSPNPLFGDDNLSSSDMNAGVTRDHAPTLLPDIAYTSTSSSITPSLPPTISSLTSSETFPLSKVSSLSNNSQTRQTRSLPSTPKPTTAGLPNNGNVTTTNPSTCNHNSSLCYINHSEIMAPISIENNETAELERNMYSDGIERNESTPLRTTETPDTDESHDMIKNITDILVSSEIAMNQSSTEVNGTGNENNTNTTEQRHNNARRNARLGDQLLPYEQVFTLTYWMFYPYNKGKKVCTVNLGSFLGPLFKPRVKGLCHGEEITMGNHVGDWEHVSIQFKGSRPHRMYVSTHTFGAFYTYDPQKHMFFYESDDTRKGLPMSPVYPRTIQLQGSHPVLYSAKGSHGLWGTGGVHVYNSLPELTDETGRGTPWKTWTNMKLVDNEISASLDLHRSWWWYEGRWGNPSSSCHLLLGGFCEHVKGPTGIPRKRINFPCQRV